MAVYGNKQLTFFFSIAFSLGCFLTKLLSESNLVLIKPARLNSPPGYEVRTILRPLEPDISINVVFDKRVIRSIQKKPCDCIFRWHHQFYSDKDWSAREKQQNLSLQRYERRQMDMVYVFNKVNGSLPISYPAHGTLIRPLQATRLVGIRIEWFEQNDIIFGAEFKVQLRSKLGVFKLMGFVDNVLVKGLDTGLVTFQTQHPSLLNLQLHYVVYQNTKFDANTADLVELHYKGFNVTVPIHIQQYRVPWLYEYGSGKFKDRVTVVVKTFFRYSNLRRLISSIHSFYPGTRIVVADDTPDNEFTVIDGDNIDQYKMPNFTGYFAGRNLGMSQVSTEYFLYTDDDHYLLNGSSNLERLVSLLDETNIHLVGLCGTQSTKIIGQIFNFMGDGDHACIFREFGYHYEVPEYPGCFVVDMVTNFFMGTTLEARAVGFDPHRLLAVSGHREFFYSAFGRMRVAACIDVKYVHERTGDTHFEQYMIHRKPSRQNSHSQMMYELYKNHLGCLTPAPKVPADFHPFLKSNEGKP